MRSIDTSAYWWDKDKKGSEVAVALFGTVQGIEQDTRGWRKDNALAAGLYSNTAPVLFPNTVHATNPRDGAMSMRGGLCINLIASCADTLINKVAKNTPRVRFVTDGGDDRMQVKARNLTRYMDAVFVDAKVYKVSKHVFRDALIYGTGAWKVITDEHTKRIVVEHTYINELLVDPTDGLYGDPQEIHHRKLVNKHKLQLMYSEHAAALEGASTVTVFQGGNSSTLIQQVEVIETWRKPSFKGSGDGRHVICTSNCVLLDEPYDLDSFPFVFLRWKDPAIGFFGTSLVWDIQEIQKEVNRYLRSIRMSLAMAVPKLLVEANTTVSPSARVFGEEGIGLEVKWSGMTPPAVVAPTFVVPPEVYNFVWRMREEAFRISGVNELASSGKKPAGLNSGAAQREYNDLAAERFATLSKDFEQCFVELADAIIDQSKRLYGKGSKVRLFGKGSFSEVKWGEVDMKRDMFVMSVFPVSQLPTTPAARLTAIQELAEAGLVDRDQIEDLMDMPDITANMRQASAPWRAAFHQVCQIVEEGKYEAPNRNMKLDTALKCALIHYNDMLTWPERDVDKMDLLEDYIDEVKDLIRQATEAQQPSQPTGAPEGALPQQPTEPMVQAQ